MPINTSLRDAITAAGGTPTQHSTVHSLRELVAAYGGAPTQFAITPLLREAIVAKGGAPTQFSVVGLLRELVSELGGSPSTWDVDALAAQVAEHSAAGETIGPELVANGAFDDEFSWDVVNFSGNTLIEGGVLKLGDEFDDGDSVSQSIGAVVGHTYRVSFEVVARTVGGVRVRVGSGNGAFRTAVGVYEEDITATGSNLVEFAQGNSPVGIQVDNVSVREVLA